MRLRTLCAMATAIVAALGLSTDVSASVLGVAGEFNAFIFGNLDANSGDTEGRLAVGGNIVAESYSVGHGGVGAAAPLTAPLSDNLIVGNDLTANGGWQVYNGNAVYGGNLIASPTFQHGGASRGTRIDFAAAQADLIAKSQLWSTLAPNGVSELLWGSTLALTGLDPVLNIFNVLESDWEVSSDKIIDVPLGSTVLVNIAGKDLTYSGGLEVKGHRNPQNPINGSVLYNFYEAKTITQSSMALLGSMLAPHADLTMRSGSVNGNSVVAKATTYWGGEFHNFAFTGDLPTPSPDPEPTSTPEPSSAVIGVALCAMGTFAARKRLFA